MLRVSFNKMFVFNDMLRVLVTSLNNTFAFNNMLRVLVTSFNNMSAFNETLRVLVTSVNNMLRVVHDTFMVCRIKRGLLPYKETKKCISV